MKYYIISGEASGDMHAANLVESIRKLDDEAVCRAWGGSKLQQQNVTLVKHIKDLAFMGFWEVLVHLPIILRNLSFCKKDLLQFSPDALILVDYPGFNLRIAKYAKQKGIKVFYYISPQLWAWKKGRIKQIRKSVDKMFVILPFEQEFYARLGFPVEYMGHPLLDELNKNEFTSSVSAEKEIIALLPGSRQQEVSKILPLMLSVVDAFEEYQFVIAGHENLEEDFYNSIIGKKNVQIVYGETYGLLLQAKAALVTSGTATLETALFNIPQVVCYKTNPITYFLAKTVVKIPFISLVNIILGKEVIKELVQNHLNTTKLTVSLQEILNETNRKDILKEYESLKIQLRGVGASERIAKNMLQFLRK